jgi:hypothetical protein
VLELFSTILLSCYSRFPVVFVFRDIWVLHSSLTHGICAVHLSKINGTGLLSATASQVLWTKSRHPSYYVQSIFRVIEYVLLLFRKL